MSKIKGILLVQLLILATLSAGAATSFTAKSWRIALPLPGILCTNPSGQVHLKGNVHLQRVQADDPRATGRLQAGMDLAYQTNGTALFSGSAFCEVGVWDAAGAGFTRTDGVWDLNYRGTVEPDGTTHYTMAGYGIGGSIDGLRIELAATRPTGGDPTISSGTIKPAPLDTTVVVDDFSGPSPNLMNSGAGYGAFSAVQTNGELALGGKWNLPTTEITGYCAWGSFSSGTWAVQDGNTLELRADLAGLNEPATAYLLAIYHQTGQAYVVSKARDWIGIWKQYLPGNACLRLDKIATRNTDVVLVLALTPVAENVVIAARLLDKADGGRVVYQGTFVDTPGSEPTLTQAEVAQITGGRIWQDIRSDPSIAPWTSGTAPVLGVFQDGDGTVPAAVATFDNLQFRTYELPQVTIDRGVRLSWPTTGRNYVIYGAPTVLGPWLPVQAAVPPGFDQVYLPQDGTMGVFQLR